QTCALPIWRELEAGEIGLEVRMRHESELEPLALAQLAQPGRRGQPHPFPDEARVVALRVQLPLAGPAAHGSREVRAPRGHEQDVTASPGAGTLLREGDQAIVPREP